MLGKLTRWLRMLGYDVTYSHSLDDKHLIHTAKVERRILLSRDLVLYHQAKKHGIRVILVEGVTVADKLATLATQSDLKLEFDITGSRCPKCNTRISPIPKHRVVDRVPPGTWARYTEFWECPTCNQVYWHGSHWQQINQTLKKAQQLLTQR